ncbi:MAG: hypothetical protein A2277_03345 [Desulfobacterales bacterium RIFOXYA12_FULL_46_15]|nr:MAG: hypothetical protein A2097_06835 [Desulfobacula sp. GWF2_41_7]OGR27375.1 MAG: hypothetical protein A2277_03345 [Desulfobacterales bacterium RIFOXYA12_FULL_46_15]
MSPGTETLKILVVDDEQNIRQSFTDFLEDREFNVLTAENGRTGLAVLAKERVDVVLLDLRMPGMDGLEVLKQGTKIAPDTPMIVISGVNRIGDVVEALRQGAWDYLEKPILDLSILAHAVDKALEKARLIRENRDYQDHLEKMVAERTLALEIANTHLSNINTRLRKVVETTRGLSGCVGLSRFSSRILDEFAAHMAATGGSCYMAEEKGLRLMHCLDPGHAPEFLPFPLAPQSVLNKVIKSGRPLLIEDVTSAGSPEPSGWEGYTDGSILAFPIPDGTGQTVGVLTLHSKAEPPFVEQDKEIGAILASYSCETLRAVKAFETVQKSEKQYRTLFEKTNDAIFIVEKDSGRFIDANTAAAELTGRSIEELKQITTRDVIPKGEEEKFLVPDTSDRAREIGLMTFCRPDQTCRMARLSTVLLNDNTMIGIARDITHDLEMEDQLRQSQKMEAIGTLAGGIAHDFNNILAGIMGYSELVMEDLNKFNLPDPVRQKMDRVIAASVRAKDLVRQILTFSRSGTGDPFPVKVSLVAKEILQLLKASLPSYIKIETSFDSDSKIMADPTGLHQIFMNLCTNARDAMAEKGGILSLKLEDVYLDTADIVLPEGISKGQFILISVKDTGHGMEKKILDNILEPFFTTKPPGKGTGMGLSMVHGIVKSLNGFLKISSTPGEGSLFEVFLPVCKNDSKVKKTMAGVIKKHTGHETILLVDDEILLAEMEQISLESYGYRVTIFSKSSAALEHFKVHGKRYDLVISDVTMPEITGDVLAQKIRSIRPDIPIILCTGYSERMDEQIAGLLGINALLFKPVPVETMLLAVRSVLDGVNPQQHGSPPKKS